MRKKINFFIKSYIITIFIGLISCGIECPSSPNKYKVSSFNSEVLKIELINKKQQIKLSEIENNSISYEKYSIRMNAVMETYFALKNKKSNNVFIENSYACSPGPPETDEKIIDIEIYANKDYNSSNKLGENISHLFDVLVLNFNSSFPYYDKYDLKEFVKSRPSVASELIFLLKEAPENTSDFKFEIKYSQEGVDLNHFNFETDLIEIRKN